jgi:hypothetical protein
MNIFVDLLYIIVDDNASMATAQITCDNCGKCFKFPYLLKRHESRKTPCVPIVDKNQLSEDILKDPDLENKRCRFCGRVFSSYTSMRRHIRTTCQIAPNKRNGDKGMELLYEHTIRKQQEQIASMQRMLERQSKLLTSLVLQAGPKINAGEVAIQGDQNQTDNRKTTININVFGKEGLDHVTVEKIRNILDTSLQASQLSLAANAAMLRTAMMVYSDPDHPENLTCFLPNKKRKEALVHTDKGWEVQPTQLVVSPMAQKTLDTIFDRQPFENADEYAPLMRELAENEKRYSAGSELRPVLVRNKALLARALESLPLVKRDK